MTLHFENDYTQGMHPALLEALAETNSLNLSGYGSDDYTTRATAKIREACQAPQAQVTFLTGGTQTNQVAIASLLAPYQGVVSADSGHINVHEAGAIEFTGHKVLTLPNHEGKIRPSDLAAYLEAFEANPTKGHMVQPGMVYISHPTEYGTLYSKSELSDLSEICRQYDLPLFLDGARLGYGLAAETDVDLPTIAKLCQAFYIGGTKLGAIAGEALVFTQGHQPKHFTNMVKQHGALLAKGRLYGVQFDRFFTDDLYLSIGRQAVDLAMQLKAILAEKGYRFYVESPTNQQFVIMPNQDLERLQSSLVYAAWDKYDDDHTIIRLATSWSTTQEDIDQLRALL